MPYGIETSILDRKGYSMSLRFTKPGSSGQRTLHVNCRKVGGDVRLRHNQVADAKRLCREAGWLIKEAAEPERTQVTTTSPAVARILNDQPEPALGVALKDALQTAPPPVEKPEPVKQPDPPKPKPPAVYNARLAIYQRRHTASTFALVVEKDAITERALTYIWEAVEVRSDLIILKPTPNGRRRWTSYSHDDYRALNIEADYNSPLFNKGTFGLTDCLIEVAEDETITILVPTKETREAARAEPARPIIAAPTPEPIVQAAQATPAAPPAPVERNPIEVLKEAKETINALRRKVPGLTIGVTPDGDVEFTLKI